MNEIHIQEHFLKMDEHFRNWWTILEFNEYVENIDQISNFMNIF